VVDKCLRLDASIAISLTLNVTSGPSGTMGWEDVAEAVSRELVRRLRYLV
jgi:hypothetical protein